MEILNEIQGIHIINTVSQVQYRRLYLLTVVLGLGGSFQYGIQVSMMAPAAEVSFTSFKISNQTKNPSLIC